MHESLTKRLDQLCGEQLQTRPRTNQWQAAEALSRRVVAEMETGEGKTLTVAMAAIAMACKGQRVFVATANDYLAQRDCTQMQPLFDGMQLKNATIQSSMDRGLRQTAYAKDIVYGTIREFGFDRLRDEQASRDNVKSSIPIVPPFDALIVDEADSVLIDEASTPLVLTASGAVSSITQADLFRWAAEFSQGLRLGSEFVSHASSYGFALSDQGIAKIIHAALPKTLNAFSMFDLQHAVERALRVANQYLRDVHYLVSENHIELIDDTTGRVTSAKKLGDGLHQALEAKERVSITSSGTVIARMTVQELVNQFAHLSGITATAWEDRGELVEVYGVSIKRFASTHQSRRKQLQSIALHDERSKTEALIRETADAMRSRRAVLIGTQTVQQSERLSVSLTQAGIDHVVLNARQSKEEAAVIACAGEAGRVTVATNMAGRGTDIRITDEVRRRGGLHVVIAQPHRLARIDRQLAGRCARQGDPGTVRQYFSSENLVDPTSGSLDNPTSVSRINLARLPLAVGRIQRTHSRSLRKQRLYLASLEAQRERDMREIGLHPHLDCLSDN